MRLGPNTRDDADPSRLWFAAERIVTVLFAIIILVGIYATLTSPPAQKRRR